MTSETRNTLQDFVDEWKRIRICKEEFITEELAIAIYHTLKIESKIPTSGDQRISSFGINEETLNTFIQKVANNTPWKQKTYDPFGKPITYGTFGVNPNFNQFKYSLEDTLYEFAKKFEKELGHKSSQALAFANG